MNFPLVENTFGSEEITAMNEVLISNKLTMGNRVAEFEREFAQYIGVPYAVMVNSGSSANLLALAAIANPWRKRTVKSDSKFLCPAVCWSTSFYPIEQMHYHTIFVDVNPVTANIDLTDLELKLKLHGDITGLVLVHVMGNCADMTRVMELVTEYDLILVEDTCEALGATYQGRKLGTFGEFGTYSFYYSHHLTTVEGGMVICQTAEDYNLLKCLRAHGWTRHMDNYSELSAKYTDIDNRFTFVNLGYNVRPMEIQAAMGSKQLKILDEKNSNRNSNFNRIAALLRADGKIKTVQPQKNANPAWFSMILYLDPKINLKEYLLRLTANGVENRPVISGNMVRQPVVSLLKITDDPTSFTGAEYIHFHGFVIGLSCNLLSDERIQELVSILGGTLP